MQSSIFNSQKKSSAFIILLSLLLGSIDVKAQDKPFGGILGKIKKATENINLNNFKPGTAITTSMADTLYGIKWLDEQLAYSEPDTISDFNLKPGHYRTTIRSYCLHAGVYGPTKGDGYQIAELKGAKADVIRSIMEKSPLYPDIDQRSIQTLIWGIEAGAKFSSYPLDFQLRVKPLLTEQEILAMQVDVGDAVDKLLPDNLKSLAATYSSLRNKMQAAQLKYDEIESIALLAGVPPLGKGSKLINKGIWSYIGDGFYLKADPRGYSTTDIELFRPAKLKIEHDSKNRISSFANETSKVQIHYLDSSDEEFIKSENGKSVPVWKINKFTLSGNEPGQLLEIPCDEWILRGNYTEIERLLGNDVINPIDLIPESYLAGKGPSTGVTNPEGFIRSHGIADSESFSSRFKKIKDFVDKIKDYYGDAKDIQDAKDIKPIEDYTNEAAVNQSIAEALKAASNPIDKKGQSKWIGKNLKMTLDLFFHSICELQGGCDNDPKQPQLPSHPAHPGTTSLQRIGLSPYKKM